MYCLPYLIRFWGRPYIKSQPNQTSGICLEMANAKSFLEKFLKIFFEMYYAHLGSRDGRPLFYGGVPPVADSNIRRTIPHTLAVHHATATKNALRWSLERPLT